MVSGASLRATDLCGDHTKRIRYNLLKARALDYPPLVWSPGHVELRRGESMTVVRFLAKHRWLRWVFSIAAGLLLSGAPVAVAKPGTPVFAFPAPAHWPPEAVLGWTGVANTFTHPCQFNEITAQDIADGSLLRVRVSPGGYETALGGQWAIQPITQWVYLSRTPTFLLQDGHQYRFAVRSGEFTTETDLCVFERATNIVYGDQSAFTSPPTGIDLTPPIVSMTVGGREPIPATFAFKGRNYVDFPIFVLPNPVARVQASATDPIPPGGTFASGVARIEFVGSTPQETSVLSSEPLVFNEGVNGLLVVAHDAAGNRGFSPPLVWVDRTPPKIAVSQASAWSVPAGVPVTIAAVVSDEGPAVGPAPVTWRFDDGRVMTGSSVTRRYQRDGTFCGTANTRDLVGNSASTSFVIRVGFTKRAPDIGSVRISGSRRVGSRLTVRSCIARTGWVRVALRRGGSVVASRYVYAQPGILETRFTLRTAGSLEVRVSTRQSRTTRGVRVT